MQSIRKTSVILVGAFLLGAAATANAATFDVLAVKIPFRFVVRGQSFPAGQYMIQRDDTSSSVLLIHGKRSNQTTMFVSARPTGGKDPAGSAPALVFTRGEKQYQLSSVWESGDQGWRVSGR